MIERLDQMTLADLIEVSCGDMKPLGCEDDAEAFKVANKIINEYLSIAQPQRAKMHLNDDEEVTKLAMREKCLKILMLLCEMGHPGRAKEVLLELGVSEAHLKDDHAIQVRCRAMLDEVRYEIRRLQEQRKNDADKLKSHEDTRKAWYSEIAFVMSTLKTAIDPATLNAAIYANLVHAASERAKAMAKIPHSLGMIL